MGAHFTRPNPHLPCFHTRRGRSPAGVGTSRGEKGSMNRGGGVHDEESWCMTAAVFWNLPNSHEKMVEAPKNKNQEEIGNVGSFWENTLIIETTIQPLQVEYVYNSYIIWCRVVYIAILFLNNCYLSFRSHPDFSFSYFPSHFLKARQPANEPCEVSRSLIQLQRHH